MQRINVTKTFLPPLDDYEKYLDIIWENSYLTNQGPLVKEFEYEFQSRLNIKNFHFVTNGTLALQIALRALGITEGEIITTPFSYVATTSSILWERCTPRFVDIEPETLNLDVSKIEREINENTKAIMAVHVFGFPCDVDGIDRIAKKHKLKVIYDAAHAVGVEYKGKSLLSYGDISICSFHATKLIHTIEGGGIVVNNPKFNETVELIKRFGHNGDDHLRLGINAKASEFQAAMGLCNLPYLDSIISNRKESTELYDKLLNKLKVTLSSDKLLKYNYSYYPLVLNDEEKLLRLKKRLEKENIFPRRYFYPSLNTLPYIDSRQHCPISEDISKRILCLPLYYGIERKSIERICEVINS